MDTVHSNFFYVMYTKRDNEFRLFHLGNDNERKGIHNWPITLTDKQVNLMLLGLDPRSDIE